MTRRFIVSPRAERDVQAAYQWYESQRVGLGEEFLSAVEQKLSAVRAFPEANAVLYPSRVAVLAVLHHARDPAVWPRR